MIIVFGMLGVLAFAGCGEKQAETPDVTGTMMPTPTEAIDITEAVKDEEPLYTDSLSYQEETDEAKDGDFVYFKSKLIYPVYEGENGEIMNRFVMSITEAFREDLPEAKEDAELDYEDSKSAEVTYTMFPEVEEFTVSCVWAKDEIQVLRTQWYRDVGGAHPGIHYEVYVVDATSGKQKTFENMILPYGLTTAEIVAYASEKIEKEFGEELYDFDDESYLEQKVQQFTQENQWYFNENGLVLFANSYQIAPYTVGIIECEISYEELEQGLKK